MSTTLSGKISTTLSWDYQRVLDLGTAKDNSSLKGESILDTVENLAATNPVFEGTLLFHDSRRVTSSSPVDDLDLTGVLKDIFGDTLGLLEVKALLIVNNSTTAGDKVTVGGAGAGNNAWGSPFNGNQDARLICGPSGHIALSNPLDGYAVLNSNSDVLRVTYLGVSGTVRFDVAIVGT